MNTGETSDWRRVLQPPVICLKPSELVVDPLVAIQATVRREFKDYALARGVVRVQPSDATLVNVDTTFSTDTQSYDLPVKNILGRAVHVRADAARYDWHFGDGSVARDAGPGAAGKKVVVHRYLQPRAVQPYVSITWRGSFRVGDDPTVYDIDETVTVDGPPTPLRVLAARSELVAD